MNRTMLVEHVADWHTDLQVDRTGRLVRNVALTGGTSKNGYRYTEQALRDAAALYEQRPVFLDHAVDKARPQERSTRDLVGSIVEPRYDSGRIRADIRVLDTESGRTFLALAESDAPGVGMSHVVLAERDNPDGAVTRIRDVVSVDAVVFPATTTTFRESHAAADSSAEPSADSPVESFPDAAPAHDPAPSSDSAGRAHPVTSESTTQQRRSTHDASDAAAEPQQPGDETLRARLRQLLNERDELLAALDQVRRRQSAEREQHALAELLSETGLPEFALTHAFRRQLLAADTPRRRELLQERQELIEQARRRPPFSRERAASPPSVPPDAAFIATVKRHAP